MPYIGNQPYQGVIDSGNIVDGSIQTGDLANSAVTTAKIADTGVTVAKLNSDVTQLIAQGGGPKITGVAITNSSWTVLDDTAVDTAGGYIKLTGTNFVTGCSVVVGTISATAVTFTSSTELRVQLPAQAAGTYILYVTNPDGGTAIRVNAVTYSATPSWVTSSTLPQQDDGVAISIQLSATSATTYALQAGSTLPSGLTLTSGGLLSGTVSGLANDTSYSFTVIATDAELQDSPRAFTVNIAASDPYFNLTTLLINGDTAPNVLTDASSNNFNLTAYGDSRASNFTPYGTGWSNYFDGSSDYLTVPSSSAFNFGLNDFTIELWVYPITQGGHGSGNNDCLLDFRPGGATIAGTLYIYNNGTGVYWFANSANRISGGPILNNTWNHIAVSRQSGNTKLFINGNQSGSTYSDSNNYPSAPIRIGEMNDGTGGGNFHGYMSNIRITNGVAVYTGNFTTPTQPLTVTQSSGTNISAITGTQTSLLTCHANRIVDGSANNLTITRTGDVAVRSFNPFNITNTGVNGSAYFDGTGDYIQVANSANLDVGTGDFSIEAWCYKTNTSTATDWRVMGGSASSSGFFGDGGTTSSRGFGIGRSGVAWDVTSNVQAPIYEWFHICYTRKSGAVRIFLNGKLIAYAAGNTNNYGLNAGTLQIVAELGGNLLTGYLTDFRLFKTVPSGYDTAATTINTQVFTPPTFPLTAITNTQLLTLQNKQPHNNHSFQDSSTNNHLITRNGNTTQGTFSPFSQTGWGNYFDGSSYLSISTASSTLDLGTGDFTIEMWVNPLTQTTSYPTIISCASAWSAGAFYIRYSNTGAANKFGIYWNGVGDPFFVSSSTYPENTWHHVAVTRSGSTVTLWVNGASAGTGNSSASLNLALGGGVWVGNNASSSCNYKGYISNIRVVKNVAVYTGAFTPPTSPLAATQSAGTNISAITGTQTSLLTCQSNRFIDNSTNNFTITRNGDTRVVAFSPFKPTAAYSPTTHGGSLYLDGTGDNLQIADTPNIRPGSGDFTYEFWWYPTSLAANYQEVITKGTGLQIYTNLSTMYFGVSANNTGTYFINSSFGTLTANAWNHIVICRQANNYYAYLNGLKTTFSSSSSSPDTGTDIMYIGRYSSPEYPTIGYISNFRFVKGTAIYTAASIPTLPTSPVTATTDTQLLLNFTDAGIRDATSKNVLETVGDAQISTAQYKFQPSSMAFDGNGDYLFTPSSVDFVFNGDFTIEFWVYRAGSSAGGTGNYECLVATYNGSTGYGVWWLNTTNVFHTRVEGTTADTTTALSNSTWYHVAVTRSGSTVRTFVNGVQGSSLTSSATAANPGLYIGAQTVNKHFNGYIQDFRITKGYARYTTNFTPPAQKFKLR